MTALEANPAAAWLPRRCLVLLALVVVGLGCRKPAPDPYAIVKAAAASYEGLRCYHVVWTTRTTSSKTPGKVTTTRMVMAAAPGGRFRGEIDRKSVV